MTAAAPITVNVVRGPAIESRHSVHAVLMDSSGKIKAAYGDAKRLTFPRSTLKPLQTLALIKSGAADAFKLSEEEIALATASHNGEEEHVERVKAWLKRIDFDVNDLECGAHAPYGAPCLSPFTALHNNCSGKHTGMLTLSLFLKADARGYTKTDHPVQKAILSAISVVCGEEITPATCGIDGCSAPNPAMPLQNLAHGMATFIRQDNSETKRIYQAMVKHAYLVGGTDRLDTVLMQAAKGKILTKTGAEGVYIAVIPEKDAAIALKTEDGASRAAHAALFALFEKHRLADDAVMKAIQPLCLPVIKNWRGLETGGATVEL